MKALYEKNAESGKVIDKAEAIIMIYGIPEMKGKPYRIHATEAETRFMIEEMYEIRFWKDKNGRMNWSRSGFINYESKKMKDRKNKRNIQEY